MSLNKKLVAIVGQTGSGKTDLAIRLAQKFEGEIVCADSRTIYKEMNVGTAKPTQEQTKEIVHHCLDLVSPDQMYSVAQFKRDADQAIHQIISNDKLPFLVGGSGLYIDAVLYDFELNKASVNKVDKRLSLSNLQALAKELNLDVTEQTMKNKQHLIRFIERNGQDSRAIKTDALIIGISVDKPTLEKRITARIGKMFSDGLVAEAQSLLGKYPKSSRSLNAPGYRVVGQYVEGKVSLEQAKSNFIKQDLVLAKKQKTWFKRNADIYWVDGYNEAEQLIGKYLLQ